ncbi:hypothetical protein FRX31_033254 [Thalictrum thalictroides]|uniref:Cysteine proteinase inhibitor n=1 Tax=Thalictrum thalictroides TaxID=46969 RepID=A0A7J6UX62_THATH|nr:hypothetical protein FRX31_033254 [Thalictrum thalictroides]
MEKKHFPTAITPECFYVPKIVQNKEIFASQKYTNMAKLIVTDWNGESNANFVFQQIIEADCEKNYVCAGCFHFLTILAKDITEKTVILSNIVWKGSSMDVLPGRVVVNAIPDSNTLLPVSDARIQKMVILALQRNKLLASNVLAEVTQSSTFQKRSGYIRFITYRLYFTPQGEPEKTVTILVLHRKWCYPIDTSFARGLRRKVLKPEDLFNKNHPLVFPPLHKNKIIDDHTQSSTVELLEIDLLSPMILSCAWCAVDNYNFAEGTNLELVSPLKAIRRDCAGVYFILTLKVKDKFTNDYNCLNASVWIRPWLKSVKIVSSSLTEWISKPKQLHVYKRRISLGSSSTSSVNR